MSGITAHIQQILLLIPAVLVGFTFHEFAHAYTAVKLGDRTPIDQGRYTLNPLAHISLVGFVLILFVGIGWAKPVQFNPANFRKPRRDEMLVALAGPLMNLALAILFLLFIKALVLVNPGLLLPSAGSLLTQRFLISFVWINLVLFIFNLLPIPPLDGSHLVLGAIPERYAAARKRYMQIGVAALVIALLVSSITPYNILPIGSLANFAFQFLARLLWGS